MKSFTPAAIKSKTGMGTYFLSKLRPIYYLGELLL